MRTTKQPTNFHLILLQRFFADYESSLNVTYDFEEKGSDSPEAFELKSRDSGSLVIFLYKLLIEFSERVENFMSLC